MKVDFKIAAAAAVILFLVGCAHVPMATRSESNALKKYAAPSPGKAGLYVYRNGSWGKALKKDLRVDGTCLGESAAKVFFFTEVEGGRSHRIETESEFSPNGLDLFTEAGKNYYVRQFIKLGLFAGGADLEVVPEEKAQADMTKLRLAQPGTCGEENVEVKR